MNQTKQTEKRLPSSPRREGKVRWEFNRLLLRNSLILGSILVTVVAIAYWYQSRSLTNVLHQKAAKARVDQDWEQQITWLNQLLKVQPDADAAVIERAFAADLAASVPPANSVDKISRARRQLLTAVSVSANSGASERPETDQLRRLLIIRESQFRPRYAGSVMRQIIELNPPHDDVLMLKAFAFASDSLVADRQNIEASAIDLTSEELAELKAKNFWLWLSKKPYTVALAIAWRAEPNDARIASAILRSKLDNPTFFENTLGTDAPKLVGQITKHLASLPSNGLAQTVLFDFKRESRSNDAASFINLAGFDAFNRLISTGANSDVPKTPIEGGARTLPTLTIAEEYDPAVDFQLALIWFRAIVLFIPPFIVIPLHAL